MSLVSPWQDGLLIKDDKTKHYTDPKITSELMGGDLLLCFRDKKHEYIKNYK